MYFHLALLEKRQFLRQLNWYYKISYTPGVSNEVGVYIVDWNCDADRSRKSKGYSLQNMSRLKRFQMGLSITRFKQGCTKNARN